MNIIIDIPDKDLSGFFFNEQTYDNPCERCMNNPKNNPNASGFCNCALPYMSGKQRITCGTTRMRDATIEESTSVNKYIRSISMGTGKNFYDYLTMHTGNSCHVYLGGD